MGEPGWGELPFHLIDQRCESGEDLFRVAQAGHVVDGGGRGD